MDLQNRLSQAVKRLEDAGIESAVKDARLITAHVHGIDASRLTLHLHDACGWGAAQENHFLDLLEDRANHRPVAKIIGHKAFWGRDFLVNDDVLDPRPETETLIAAALEIPFDRVLDLGTGSGAIVITLLAERASANGVACDLSDAALTVAAQNADILGVVDRVDLVKGDMFEPVAPQVFDLIVSNPPYLAKDEIAAISEDTAFDPRIALTDEADGLSFYRIIASQSPQYLTERGSVLVEIGPTQGPAVVQMFTNAGFGQVSILPDLDGRDRVVTATGYKNG